MAYIDFEPADYLDDIDTMSLIREINSRELDGDELKSLNKCLFKSPNQQQFSLEHQLKMELITEKIIDRYSYCELLEKLKNFD